MGGEHDDLIYEKLPHDIAHRHVLLMDPILGTGNTVARAVQVRTCPLPFFCKLCESVSPARA